MAIITDELHNNGNDYYIEALGEHILFRKSDYIIEYPLYRYRSNLSWAMEEIKTGHIHISNLEELNDPFDSSYALDIDAFSNEQYPISVLMKCTSAVSLIGLNPINWDERLEPDLAHASADGITTVDNFTQLLSKHSSYSSAEILHSLYLFLGSYIRRHGGEYKVASFSESDTSIPMWTYYANNHQGVCLKYDIGKLSSEGYESELKKAFVKIHYSDYRPKDQHGEYSSVVKSSQWSHEHEWRLICKTKEDYISVPCLSAVILGLGFDYERIDDVITAIKESGRQVSLFKCIPDQEKYELKKIRIQIT